MSRFSILSFLFSLSLVAGCGAPGAPSPPQPVVPEAIKDLGVRQEGDSVVLSFTMPASSIAGEKLVEAPAIEIFRAFAPSSAQGKKVATRLHVTIPGALADTFGADGRIRYVDPLRPEEVAAHSGEQAVYMVRTRAAKRRASADSNTAAIRLFPSPEAIVDVRATVTAEAVELAWTPPQRTSAGAPLASLAGYRIYRAEVDPESAAAAAADPAKAVLRAPLELLGPASGPSYRDTQFEFGKTYLYTVRSIAEYESEAIESADSRATVVTPRDVFPPAPPAGLVIVFVPAAEGAAAHVELTWQISRETDLAGYYVYRSEQEGARGERVTPELLPTPAFRDNSVQPGRRYFYRATALDRAGNESSPSAVISVDVPQREH